MGEHQSLVYESPALPKRAETFGGFDASLAVGGKAKRRSDSQTGGAEAAAAAAGGVCIGGCGYRWGTDTTVGMPPSMPSRVRKFIPESKGAARVAQQLVDALRRTQPRCGCCSGLR